MKDSIQQKLQNLVLRHEELAHLLNDPDLVKDVDKFKKLSKEYAELEDLSRIYVAYCKAVQAEADSKEMLQAEADDDLRLMAEEDIAASQKAQMDYQLELEAMLVPKDPADDGNIFLEVRAGTGGDEAAIFAGDLFKMYSRYAERQGWRIELINESLGEHGGFKEVIARVVGQGAYSYLKFESGGHRVQRVPETEAQGRIHTSACTVAVMPEVATVDEILIKPSDLRIDTYRASGAGGQHVNKTDSAIRITHIPTGTVVECQDERSQHKNRARAMSLLQSRLLTAEREKQTQATAATRRVLVGSGDRSARIRTYNYPQGRVTDHRINLTLYQLDAIMMGDMTELVGSLRREHQADLLAEMVGEA